MKYDNPKKTIRACFNAASQTYDSHSIIQHQAGANLITLLIPHLASSESIIDIGCGTGLTTERLAKQLPYQSFFAIDIADQLLNTARARLRPYNIQIDERDFHHLTDKNNGFNLIFSNMALHWSPSLAFTLATLKDFLAHNGILTFTVPLASTFIELALYPSNVQNAHVQCFVLERVAF
jgi:malonyl-CoA O-methyltransferase